MRNLKKIISLALALMMVLSMMVTANAAFADQASINADYAEAVEVMNGIGVLQGDGTNFKPTGTLTRAEAAVILAKIHSAKSDVKWFENETKYTENPFADVSGWAEPYVLYCYENQITGGTGATSYSPRKTLTGYEFAKMLLVAMGEGKHADYVGDETQTWEQKTLAAAKDVNLLAGLDITLKSPITREQASHMALNAMVNGGSTTYTYYVSNTAPTTPNTAPKTYVTKTTDVGEAYLMKSILYSSDKDVEVYTVATTVGNLLAGFGLQQVAGVDQFGRPSTVYQWKANNQTYLAFANAPAAKYTAKTSAATIAADLGTYRDVDGLYAVGQDAKLINGTYTYEVASGTLYTGDATNGIYNVSVDTNVNMATHLAGLTGANRTVEVYVGHNGTYGYISRVVVVEDFINEVSATTPANTTTVPVTPAKATVDSKQFNNTLGLVQGDVVSYNINLAGNIVEVAKATGFEGKVTGYSNAGTYTINGGTYALGGYAASQADTVKGNLTAANNLMFYPGAAGTILYVDGIEGQVTTYADYVQIVDTYVTKTTGAWGKTSYTIDVKVLKADGTTADWTLPVNTQKTNGDTIYFALNDTTVLTAPLEVTYSTGDTLDTMVGAVYTTSGDALMGELPAKADNSQNGAFGIGNETITAGTTYVVADDVYLNEKTVFVLSDGKGGYTTKTGLNSLTKENITGAYVVGSQTYDATTDTYTRVATLVFASGIKVDNSTTAVSTNNLVFNTGVYSISLDTNQQVVYTYTVIDAAGNAGTATYTADDLAVGIYKLNTNGSINTTGAITTVKTVGYVSSTLVVIDSTAYTVDADVVVHDVSTAQKGLVTGAKLYFVDANSDNKPELVYVVG